MTASPSPRVSVIIPCFNYGLYLAEAIESALAQTYPGVEVIVVDDGSTDSTAEVAGRYVARIRYAYQVNAGPAAARNRGAGLASGEFLVFLDADDILDPEYVSACVKALEASAGAAFAYTQVRYFGRRQGTSDYPDFDRRLLRRYNYIHMATLVRAELVRTAGFDADYDAGLQDWDLYLTLVGQGHVGVLVDRPLLSYRIHTAGSIQDKFQADPANGHRAVRSLARKHWRFFGLRRMVVVANYWLFVAVRLPMRQLFGFRKRQRPRL